jgi:hypothetical protein
MGITTSDNYNTVLGSMITNMTSAFGQMGTYSSAITDQNTALNGINTTLGLLQTAITNFGLNYGIAVNDATVANQDLTTSAAVTKGDIELIYSKLLTDLDTLINDKAPKLGDDLGSSVYDSLHPWIQKSMDLLTGLVTWGINQLSILQTGWSNIMSGKGWSPWATGGVALAQKGFITRGPQPAIIGEDGSEAVIPLEGRNKKYGKEILKYILPKYYPDLKYMQYGGISGGGGNTYATTTNTESFNITGPINVYGVKNVEDFTEKLKMSYRTAKK